MGVLRNLSWWQRTTGLHPPTLGRSSDLTLDAKETCQWCFILVGGRVFQSHVMRLQSPRGLASAGLRCVIRMWDIQKEFEPPPRCLLKAACAARMSLWLAMLLTSVVV